MPASDETVGNQELAPKDTLAQQTAAAEQLRDLNAQKPDFIATVSHELKTRA